MVKVDTFAIHFNNPEFVYFAGQEISGKIIVVLKERKKINEILLELKGRAKTYWTKHSGKSRKHCSDSEPYFCEQFNTGYTHRFTTSVDKGDPERYLPEGRHEVPFSYTLPKTLPTSFEGDFGFVRYTAMAICERPWDFDIICRKVFTVIGIEDINEDPKAKESAKVSDSNYNIKLCCRKQGSISLELGIDRTGYTPGEVVEMNALIKNDSQKTLRYSCAKVKQHVLYRAKTFAGTEQTKTASKVVVKKDKGEIFAQSKFDWDKEKLHLPALPPKLTRCRIIDVSYTLELEVDPGMSVSIPIIIGTIPLLGEGAVRSHLKEMNKASVSNRPSLNDDSSAAPLASSSNQKVSNTSNASNTSAAANLDQDSILVTVTDERGRLLPNNSSSTANQSSSLVEHENQGHHGQNANNKNLNNQDESTSTTPTTNKIISPSSADSDIVNEDEELHAQAQARKRVRMPSSILSELYPKLASPYYRQSFFGPVDISEDREKVQFGDNDYSPKYPIYGD